MDDATSNLEFGSWNLSEHTKNVLETTESKSDIGGTCDFRYLMLIADVRKEQAEKCMKKIPQRIVLDCFNNISFDKESKQEQIPQVSETFSEVSAESENNDSLTSRVLACVNQDVVDYKIYSTLTALKPEKRVICLAAAWKELKSQSEKHKFIKLLSADHAIVICENLILPELRNEESLETTTEMLLPIISCLENSAIDYIFIPILSNEDPFLTSKPDWLKEFIRSLSGLQMEHLMRRFLDLMEKGFKPSHLHYLSDMLDVLRINEDIMPRMVIIFDRIIEEYNNDRLFGKILFEMVSTYTMSTKPIPQELVQLSKKFKGIMRFKINATIKKCRH